MKQKIKSYLVFTSLGYRIVMFAVLPLVLLGIQVFTAVVLHSTAIPVFVMTLVLVEAVADNWFLGGIQEKGSAKIDYLKTSPRGMKVMKSALIVDLARRLVFCFALFGVCQLIAVWGSGTPGQSGAVQDEAGGSGVFGMLLLAVLLTYTLSVLGIFIARFNSYIWVNLLCGYVGAIVGLLVLLVCSVGIVPTALANLALGILGGGISFLMVKIAMLKVEGSFYDK